MASGFVSAVGVQRIDSIGYIVYKTVVKMCLLGIELRDAKHDWQFSSSWCSPVWGGTFNVKHIATIATVTYDSNGVTGAHGCGAKQNTVKATVYYRRYCLVGNIGA